MLADLWAISCSREPELMDDPSLPAAEHMAALDALGRINLISRTASRLVAGIVRLIEGRPSADGRPLRVVDLACGGGDVTVGVAAALETMRARGRIGPATVTGFDMSPRAVERAARRAAATGVGNVSFSVRDVAADGCPSCDVAVNSLFLHHLDDVTAASVLRSMAEASRCGVVVSDLIRSRCGLTLAMLGTTLLCGSRVARIDGPMSVRAARTTAEYRDLCAHAGLTEAVLRRAWPERIVIEWVKTS